MDTPTLSWFPLLDLALAEDLGTGDVTTLATIPVETQATGTIIAKAHGVVSGLPIAGAAFARVDPSIDFRPLTADGERVEAGSAVADVAGPAAGILAAERVALNFLQRLSGVATETARYVVAVAGTGVRLVDTRKTTPGMRALEKAAVRHGGGHNHRVGLADGILIKDNHLAAIGGPDPIAKAVSLARDRAPHSLRVEVEVTTLEELRRAVDAGAEVVLLDNMDIPTLRRAVELVAGRVLLEASGGVTLASVRAVAKTGVDLVSVGALTHSAPALDLSLEFRVAPTGPDS